MLVQRTDDLLGGDDATGRLRAARAGDRVRSPLDARLIFGGCLCVQVVRAPARITTPSSKIRNAHTTALTVCLFPSGADERLKRGGDARLRGADLRPKGGKHMRVVAVALVLLGLVGGCASQQSPSSGASQPSSGGSQYTSQDTCERAGRTWNGTSSVCM